jgi:hypothetical protein
MIGKLIKNKKGYGVKLGGYKIGKAKISSKILRFKERQHAINFMELGAIDEVAAVKYYNKVNSKILTGLQLARKMKKAGYSDSDIVQETGYHI